jgi:hypothetical protein
MTRRNIVKKTNNLTIIILIGMLILGVICASLSSLVRIRAPLSASAITSTKNSVFVLASGPNWIDRGNEWVYTTDTNIPTGQYNRQATPASSKAELKTALNLVNQGTAGYDDSKPHIILVSKNFSLTEQNVGVAVNSSRPIYAFHSFVEDSNVVLRKFNPLSLREEPWDFSKPLITTRLDKTNGKVAGQTVLPGDAVRTPDLYDGIGDIEISLDKNFPTNITSPAFDSPKHFAIETARVKLSTENITLRGKNTNEQVLRGENIISGGGIIVKTSNNSSAREAEEIDLAVNISGTSDTATHTSSPINLLIPEMATGITRCAINIFGGTISHNYHFRRGIIHFNDGQVLLKRTINLSGSTVLEYSVGNSAEGGGLYGYFTSNSNYKGRAAITDNVLIRNNKARSGGGVIFHGAVAAIVRDNVRIENNEAVQNGGGIELGGFASGNQQLYIRDNVHISNNTANFGGGIGTGHFNNGSSVQLWIEGGHFTENKAGVRGGAIDATNPRAVRFTTTSVAKFSDNSANFAVLADLDYQSPWWANGKWYTTVDGDRNAIRALFANNNSFSNTPPYNHLYNNYDIGMEPVAAYKSFGEIATKIKYKGKVDITVLSGAALVPAFSSQAALDGYQAFERGSSLMFEARPSSSAWVFDGFDLDWNGHLNQTMEDWTTSTAALLGYNGLPDATAENGYVQNMLASPTLTITTMPATRFTLTAHFVRAVNYPVLSHFGAFNGAGDLTAKIDAGFDDFTSLFLGNSELRDVDFSVKPGSVIITLNLAFLKSLASGSYKLTANFNDGSSDIIILTIADKAIATATPGASAEASAKMLGKGITTSLLSGLARTGVPGILNLLVSLLMLMVALSVIIAHLRRTAY